MVLFGVYFCNMFCSQILGLMLFTGGADQAGLILHVKAVKVILLWRYILIFVPQVITYFDGGQEFFSLLICKMDSITFPE